MNLAAYARNPPSCSARCRSRPRRAGHLGDPRDLGVSAFLTFLASFDARPSAFQSLLEIVVRTIDDQIRGTMQTGLDPVPRPDRDDLRKSPTGRRWCRVEPPTAHLETDAALAFIVLGATVAQRRHAQASRPYLATS